jgi:hypothetical protein
MPGGRVYPHIDETTLATLPGHTRQRGYHDSTGQRKQLSLGVSRASLLHHIGPSELFGYGWPFVQAMTKTSK